MILAAKTFGAFGLVSGAGAVILAVIDSSTQTALIGVASLTVTSLTAIILAWIAYKQNMLSKKQDALAVVVEDVKKQTDGITTKLVAVTDRASHAEGELKGKAEAQARQDAIDITALTIKTIKAEPAAVTLKKIEQNTAETADNTTKTDANVQDLKDKSA